MKQKQFLKKHFPDISVLAVLTGIFITLSTGVWEIDRIELWLFLSTVFIGIASLRRMRCALYLADKKSRITVEHGPHSTTRSPFYFFSFIGWVGMGMITGSLFLPVLVALILLLYFPSAINLEEAQLKEVYGREFEDYMAKVPRFFQ